MNRAEDAAVAGLARSLEAHGCGDVRIAFVLGSGLGAFAERLDHVVVIPFHEVEEMPSSFVAGHAGRFVSGDLRGERVVVQQGRAHLYEGWRPADVARSVRALARIGCRSLVLTNAAGGLRREWNPPGFMRIVDQINLQGSTALAGREAGWLSPYDDEVGQALDRGARDAGVELDSGVYAGLTGPAYETPAEIRMLAWMGADAVGMSTVCEANAGRAAGMRVGGISCITNHAAGISPRPLSHHEVLESGAAAAEVFGSILERSIPHLMRAVPAR